MNQYNYEYLETTKVCLDSYDVRQTNNIMIFQGHNETVMYGVHYNKLTTAMHFYRYFEEEDNGLKVFVLINHIPLGLLMAISQHAIITNV